MHKMHKQPQLIPDTFCPNYGGTRPRDPAAATIRRAPHTSRQTEASICGALVSRTGHLAIEALARCEPSA